LSTKIQTNFAADKKSISSAIDISFQSAFKSTHEAAVKATYEAANQTAVSSTKSSTNQPAFKPTNWTTSYCKTYFFSIPLPLISTLIVSIVKSVYSTFFLPYEQTI
jgi:hypothetical protein